jgi:hypothetical protein
MVSEIKREQHLSITVIEQSLTNTDTYYSSFEPFHVSIYFQLFLGIVLLIAIIIFSFVLVGLLLDRVYQKEVKQYPKHFLWDTLAPIIILIAPSILVLSIKNETFTLMNKFLLLISIHGFILIPIMYLWSKHRKWTLITDIPLHFWNDPSIYLRLSIALIYPALFGLYYTILRYLRLGQTIDIYQAFDYFNMQNSLPYIVLSIFIWPFLSIWIKIVLWKLLSIRFVLWEEFILLINSIHISMLKYTIYFYIMEILYKISYIWISYFIHDSIVYPKWPRNLFRNTLFTVYRYPSIIYFILILGCLLEIAYFKGKLFYMLYIAMVLLLIRPFIYFLNHFNGEGNQWVQACCYSDYIEGHWDKPRYSERFWQSFPDIRIRLNNLPVISDTLKEHIEMRINFVRDRVRRNRLNILNRSYKLSTRKNISKMHLIRVGYHQWAQIRWVHTSKVTSAIEPVVSKIWHPFTPYYARNFFDYVALINNDWSHYQTIQQLEKKQRIVLPENLYKNFPTIKTKTIAQALEENLITNFHPSLQYKINVQTYKKYLRLDTAAQAEPDLSFDMSKNNMFLDKRNHGLDQKSTQAPRALASNMFSNVSLDQYDQILDDFNKFLNITFYDIAPNKMHLMQQGLIHLKNTAHNFAQHQVAFASIVHLYPNNGIPPLRLPHNFALADLTDECVALLAKSNIKLRRISDLLYMMILKILKYNVF